MAPSGGRRTRCGPSSTDVQAVAVAERDDFAVSPVPVAMDPILADAAAFARALPDDHPLTCPSGVQLRVLADPQRIGQVLRNLLGNAAKFSPPGTPIEVRVTPGHERVEVAVVDQGPGIHPDDLGCIFEKYGRGRAVKGGDRLGRMIPGHGLGLYLSSRIVRAHGGELTVRSTLGQGSTFAFTLAVVP
jgi:signal transduction histidine kinase